MFVSFNTACIFFRARSDGFDVKEVGTFVVAILEAVTERSDESGHGGRRGGLPISDVESCGVFLREIVPR